ncbi:isochorismatase domain-containing protein 2 [Harpegnathos saltator]|uniref:Isochorismatase domain-containing protein 1 n=1 Tax=Harpegnathos saltator TaxID=610380 RepID=E2BVQ1_HARSA|nr:isochorismatase domain-containing protein 2 [Harpegnathos saltator]EFN80234.1 Isochorismatase domain-containing protein 1 [Harpegnathos saltator]
MAINAARAVLRQGKSALLICDIQESFAKVVKDFDNFVKNSSKMVNALRILNIPMIVSEQNPKGLGKTVTEIDISSAKGPFAKTLFSMCTPEIRKELSTICGGQAPESIILMGLEAHICVENTAVDLRIDGYEVHVVADCCVSRTQEDRLLALQRMQNIGCHIATSENVLYKLMQNANHKEFKKVLSLVKTPIAYTGLVPISKV